MIERVRKRFPEEDVDKLEQMPVSYTHLILVALMNKAGGSAAFGRWASKHIHSRAGAPFATLLLGVMIFVADYFNCLSLIHI